MRCKNCGHEMIDGEIYCEKCGKAIQIVPDFNLLEDDILPDLLSESPTHIDEELFGVKRASRQKKNSRHISIIAACILGTVIIGAVYVFGAANHGFEAEEAKAEENQTEETAAAPVEESVPAVYDATVLFSEPGGTYTENIGLTLSASDGTSSVYYTTDGTDPTSHNGTLFTKKFYITSGTTTVRAACVNADGKTGPVVEEIYVVNYEAPSMPVIVPESGTYHEETYVTVTAEEDVVLYYTWDGNNPTTDSPVYTSPLLIPEGNHILSVIAIDRHGMSSDIARSNYVYLP